MYDINTKENEKLVDEFEKDEQNISDTVFEICNEEQQLYFLAWVLDLSEQELERGKDFLIDHNTSFRVLWKLLSHLSKYTVVVEDHYVDRVYRDSYYFYYSSSILVMGVFVNVYVFFAGFWSMIFMTVHVKSWKNVLWEQL